MRGAMTVEAAHAVYDVLLKAGASERERESFVFHQTNGHVTAFRFCGVFGFGGKFWRNTDRLPDGSWGERWYVSGYDENFNDLNRAVEKITNDALEALRVEHFVA